ncbi:class I SAM-dependent methyltransferase [Pseudonocardia oroxyli]|uniref:Methyltransferase domain-containing protein n=1 Tax=Pseudonocardia oroxyli TaxID=366584 RepID=A0A1G7YPR1_PSEOR|nr:class I SAM-dependent methyltransferase [Pseudonocardia oroxyli]SDG98431.1 Methyltransferase domain-containing protein [Pseudonocardia oroxyli]
MTLPHRWYHPDTTAYDDRWSGMENPHGEADLVASYGPASVLDGGCGTGRVAIELARRGIAVVGVDPDADMIAAALAKAPELRWREEGLESLDLPDRFDVIVLAGNVIPYAGDRPGVVAGCVRHLAPGGRLIAGFTLQPGWPTLDDYDGWCAGLSLEDRWSTWDRAPYTGGAYAVSVHTRSATP